MKRIFLTLLLCLALASPAFAYRVDSVRIDEAPPRAASITVDSVRIDIAGAHRVLAPSTNIYAVTIVNDVTYNGGQIYLTTSSGAGSMLVTGNAIRIETDNLADVYVSGNTVGDLVGFIGEIR